MSGRSRSGFALIGILVVIAILAVPAGIFFSVLAAARERGRIATCQSNLRQTYSISFYHSPEQISAMTGIELTWTDGPACPAR